MGELFSDVGIAGNTRFGIIRTVCKQCSALFAVLMLLVGLIGQRRSLPLFG